MSYQIEQTILLRDYLKELPISQAMIKRRLFRNYFSNRKLKYSTRKYSFKNHL